MPFQYVRHLQQHYDQALVRSRNTVAKEAMSRRGVQPSHLRGSTYCVNDARTSVEYVANIQRVNNGTMYQWNIKPKASA